MRESSVLVSYEDRIATITLNRPEILNALDEEMLRTFLQQIQAVQASDCEVVIIRGAGRGFSAGGDIKSMLSQENNDRYFEIMEIIKELVTSLYTLPKIVVASLHGPTAGLGLSIALASDYVMAETTATIAMNFIGVGLIPDGGGHFFLQKRLGDQKAKQIIWAGQKLTASKSWELGIIDEVAKDIHERVIEKARGLLGKPVKAMIATKEIMNALSLGELLKVLELETNGQLNMRQTWDHQEGVKAFLEKRSPVFQGR